jgi:hypothetical protein
MGTGMPVIFGLCGRNGLNESFVDAANVSQTRRCGSRKSTLTVECSNELVTATRELISLPDPNSFVTLTSCHSGRLSSLFRHNHQIYNEKNRQYIETISFTL